MATWKPGHRRRPASKHVQRLEDTVIALGQVHELKLIIKAEPPPEVDTDDPLYDGRTAEAGDEIIVIQSSVYGARTLALKLSQMTTEELDSWKQLMDLAYDRARVVTVERDAIAAKAAADGDDSYIRRHRPSPTVVIRTR
jgi:hypothetical protein